MRKILEPGRGRLLLVAVLLFATAFGLRAWYGSFGARAGLRWDEGYALENVRSILETGSFRPAKSYYPSPVFNLPAAALVAGAEALHEAGAGASWDAYEGGRFLPTAYRLLRWLMALYGAVSVLLLWRLGARLAGEGVGVVAALLLTFLPWHLRACAVFKPDALLVMGVLLTLWAGLHAVSRASTPWAMVAGLGVALAASAKLTGVLVAAPLALGLVAAAPRERRRWGQLLAAGVVSAAAFVAMNPFWWAYLHFVESLKEDYAMRARWRRWTRIDAAWLSLRVFVQRSVHGPWIGGLAAAGAVGAAVSVVRDKEPVARASWAMVLVFPPLYLGMIVAQTPYFKANNLLPVMPLSCLLAAWALVGIWRWSKTRVSRSPVRRALAVAGVATLLALGVLPGWLFVYRQVTPSTMDVAQAVLGDRLNRGDRVLYSESRPGVEPQWQEARPRRAMLVEVERLATVDAARLDIADAEIFPARRLRGPQAAFYRSRMERVDAEAVQRIDSRWFSVRGAPLVVVAHPRRHVEQGELDLVPCAARPRCFRATLAGRDGGTRGRLVSFQVGVAKANLAVLSGRPALTVGGATVDLRPLRPRKASQAFASPPMVLPRPTLEIEVEIPESLRLRGPAPRLFWTTWLRPKKKSQPEGEPPSSM